MFTNTIHPARVLILCGISSGILLRGDSKTVTEKQLKDICKGKDLACVYYKDKTHEDEKKEESRITHNRNRHVL